MEGRRSNAVQDTPPGHLRASTRRATAPDLVDGPRPGARVVHGLH